MIETNIQELKNKNVCIYYAQTPGHLKRVAKWRRAVIAVEDMGFFVPAAICDEEDTVESECKLQGAGVIKYQNHLYVHLDWLRKAYWKKKDAKEILDAIENAFIGQFVLTDDA